MNKRIKKLVNAIGSAYEYGRRNGLRKLAGKTLRQVTKKKEYEVPYYRIEMRAQRRARLAVSPKISVVMPVLRDAAAETEQSIRSLLKQTYGRWELILVMAEASGEEMRALCRRWEKKDARMRQIAPAGGQGEVSCLNAGLKAAEGDYVALLDQGDVLQPSALYAVARAIADESADFVYTDEDAFREKPWDVERPLLKPDFAPDTLRSTDYIGSLMAFSRELQGHVGEFQYSSPSAARYDMALRLTEVAARAVHVPKVLYFRRERAEASAVATDELWAALAGHLERTGLEGEILDARVPGACHIRYALRAEPLVTIMIPTCEHLDDLKKCLDSIFEKTTYPNYEILLIENNSKSEEVFHYYEEIQRQRGNVRVVVWDGAFNYSAINNFGARYARGEMLLLLNNDIEVITPDWIQEMLMFAQRPEVGAVGAMLYYPDDTVQHAGVLLGVHGCAGHAFKLFKRTDVGYMNRLTFAQDMSIVTGACMMIRKAVWDELGGLDEVLAVAYNDVDLCLRMRKAGYLVVWTPFAELYHYESKSRGNEKSEERKKRHDREKGFMRERWIEEMYAGDPYYNANLTLEQGNFELR